MPRRTGLRLKLNLVILPQSLPDEAAQRAGETVASAAARIVATSHGLDHVFDRQRHIACPKTDTSGTAQAKV